MVKYHAPRKSSVAFKRVRSRRIYPRVFTWPKTDKVMLLGFPAYKVGMCTIYEKVLDKHSLLFGIERAVGATVLEAPPIRVMAIRAYASTPLGYRSVTEVWTPYIFDFERKYLGRKFPLPKKIDKKKVEEKINKLRELVADGIVDKIRLIVRTRPALTGIGKKKPELFEIEVGGPVDKALEYAIGKLGKSVEITEVFKPKQFCDIIGVTKGYGFTGVVKRHGVQILPPKTKKERRKVGSLGPWTPGGVRYTVPRYGQYGFFRRTEYNKEIIQIIPLVSDKMEDEAFTEDELKEFKERMKKLAKEYLNTDETKLPKRFVITLSPKGGWKHYGIIRNTAVIIRGSVMGPPKRMVILRHPIRPKRLVETQLTQIWYSDERLEPTLIELPA